MFKKKKKENRLTKWAEHEVVLACKRENPEWDGKSFDYGCSCYQSALDVLKHGISAFEKYGHSGASYAITKNILKRLLDEKPLTPITDEDFKLGNYELYGHREFEMYTCTRASGIFKKVYVDDGRVEYSDVDRVIGIDQYDCSFRGGMPFIEEYIPSITMPYMPKNNPYKVYVWQFMLDENNNISFQRGVCNAEFVRYIEDPDGNKTIINKLYVFKEDHDELVETDAAFRKRLERAIKKDAEDFKKEIEE